MSEFDQVLDTPEPTMQKINQNYAGFWLRWSSYVLDVVVIYIIFATIGYIIFGTMSLNPSFITALAGEFSIVMGVLTSLIAIPWLYYAIMESSELQGTLGKMALDLKVTKVSGEKISFLTATGRFFAKIISAIPLYIGFFMIGFSKDKKSLHDMMTNTIVVKK